MTSTTPPNDEKSLISVDEPRPSGFRMNLKKKKKKSSTSQDATTATRESQDTASSFFQASTLEATSSDRVAVQEFDASQPTESGPTQAPLVIPVVGPNTLGSRFAKNDKDSGDNNGKEPQGSLAPSDAVKKEEEEDEDTQAIRALQREAANPDAVRKPALPTNELVIAAREDHFQHTGGKKSQDSERETQQFQQDLEQLPKEMDLEQYESSRVPIADFGAAMLRGMGWTGEDPLKSDKNKTNNPPNEMPRPHRLGLGATPALPASLRDDDARPGNRKPKTMDQYQRDLKLKKQAQEFAQQRQRQIAQDKQQTMQNGSIVHVVTSTRRTMRAKMIQMAGVPGLNQVRVQYERESKTTDIAKGSIQGLVPRSELQEQPFVETKLEQSATKETPKYRGLESSSSSPKEEGPSRREPRDSSRWRHRDEEEYHSREDRSRHDRKRSSRDRGDEDRRYRREENSDRDHHDKKRRKRQEEDFDQRRRERDEPPRSERTWVIPQIRVRIVTEKLGRRYFKEKGVVVDVTPKGSTVEMPASSSGHRVVLDRVPERYLETALPKAGGRVVILTSSSGRDYLHSKGTLLERGKGRGVVQLHSDKSILTLSLDDLAEWVGPVDEEE